MSEWTMRKCPCGDPICKQYTISIQGSVGFDEDDARLICAAPKLLRALQLMLDGLDHPTSDGWYSTTIHIEDVNVAREAVAKALGK